jgi:hypothetical protein
MAADSGNPSPSELTVSPTVIDFLLLDEKLAPGTALDTGWGEASKDGDLAPLIHGALMYIHEHYPGHDTEAITSANGFRRGIAFAILGIVQSANATKTDQEILGTSS